MASSLMSPLLVDTWHMTLSRTDGRDKLFRLIQYVCKLLRGIDYGRANPPSSVRSAKVFDLERALGTSRQIWRLFKWASVYAKVKPRASSMSAIPTTPDLAAIISDTSLFGYYIFDNLTFLAKVGLLKNDVNASSKRAARFWLIANLTGLASAVYRLIELRKKYKYALQVAREKKDDDAQTETANLQLKTLQTTKLTTLAVCIKYTSDMLVAWSLCKQKPFHPALVGACGTASSIVGFYQVWPRYMPTG